MNGLGWYRRHFLMLIVVCGLTLLGCENAGVTLDDGGDESPAVSSPNDIRVIRGVSSLVVTWDDPAVADLAGIDRRYN